MTIDCTQHAAGQLDAGADQARSAGMRILKPSKIHTQSSLSLEVKKLLDTLVLESLLPARHEQADRGEAQGRTDDGA